MKIHEIAVYPRPPREVRTITLGIGLLQMLEEACIRAGATNKGTAREADYRAIARQLAGIRQEPE